MQFFQVCRKMLLSNIILWNFNATRYCKSKILQITWQKHTIFPRISMGQYISICVMYMLNTKILAIPISIPIGICINSMVTGGTTMVGATGAIFRIFLDCRKMLLSSICFCDFDTTKYSKSRILQITWQNVPILLS